MNLSAQIIEAINSLTGTKPEPYNIFLDGIWIETDCIAWQISNDVINKDQISSQPPFNLGDMVGADSVDLSQYPPEMREHFNKVQARMEAMISAEFQTISASAAQLPSPFNLILDQVRAIIKDESALAYLNETSWIVIAPTTNQFDILEIEKIEGSNYGLETKAIIEGLTKLDEKYGIDIMKASSSSVEFLFQNVPKGQKVKEIGDWLLKFCPDLFEAPDEFPNGKVSLWWD